ncbi:MAG: hypothetical protein QME88_05215 [Actinomycetota bacterium]|nr:hypothetical protein [Actinomycetota bacterium]
MAGDDNRLKSEKSRLRFMYAYNTAMCFSAGPPMVLAPDLVRKLLKWPHEDPVMMGIYGSIVTSVGVLSAAALRDEEKCERYLPVLYTQIMYKTLTCLLIARRLLRREASSWGMHFILWFFVLYIALLARAVPWKGEKEAVAG